MIYNRMSLVLCLLLFLLALLVGVKGLNHQSPRSTNHLQKELFQSDQDTRLLDVFSPQKPFSRDKLLDVCKGFTAAAVSFAVTGSSSADAAGLRDRLRQKQFDKPIFNRPPGEATYPEWLRGEWDVEQNFAGYLFPNAKIPKQKIVADEDVPGFKQLSIIMLPDIGDRTFNYKKRFFERDGAVVEDREFNFRNQLDNFFGRPTMTKIEYMPETNPNRLSLNFNPTNKKNVQRIELFGNARDTEFVDDNIFLNSEYLRQATFYIPNLSGVVLQIIADYQNYWYYKRSPTNPDEVEVTLLTAGYLQPQDALFFDSPTAPVVLYSHTMTMRRAKKM